MAVRQHKFKFAGLGRVLLAEDDKLVGEFLRKELEKRDIRCDLYTDFESAEKALRSEDYHALVADVFFEGGHADGLKLMAIAKDVGVPGIVITSALDLDVAKTSLNNGAEQLIEKPIDPNSLTKILVEVWENPRGLISRRERFFELHGLTDKERELTRLILKGLTNQEIADVAGTTLGTVKFYSSQIFDKFEVKHRAELFNLIFPT